MNFKKKVSGSWVDAPHYLRGTATDTITTLPADLYADGTAATIGLKGNTVLNGTPSPSAPVDVVGVGELETSGDKAGQYKIPILNGSTTTPIYLGEVQTARNVKKLVLTGTEAVSKYVYGGQNGFIVTALERSYYRRQGYCTHYPVSTSSVLSALMIGASDKGLYFGGIGDVLGVTEPEDFKTWLAQQYANGTPVIVYYAAQAESTGIVNEPLMRLTTSSNVYADSLTTTIPTTDGANTLSVDTTVQPSEVSANYHGWHPVSSAHERSGGQWD